MLSVLRFIVDLFRIERIGPSTLELDSRLMDGLYWPRDACDDVYFKIGVAWAEAGKKYSPFAYPEGWADVMQNQGFVYAKRLGGP